MNRLIISRLISPVIPLVGIPFKGYGNTFAVAKIPCRCFLKINYKFMYCSTKHSRKYLNNSTKTDLSSYIHNYLNYLFSELLDLCVDGYIDLKCECELPQIVLFAIATSEVIFEVFNVKRMNYEDYLRSLAIVDKEFWSLDPTYIASIRCAYSYQELCVLKNMYESVRLRSVEVKASYLGDIKCSEDNCLEIKPPFDIPSMSFILKYTSHVVSRIAQDLANIGYLSRSTIKHLNLLHDVETRTVLESLNSNALEPISARISSVKPVPDISSIKFYNIIIESVEK